MKSYYRTQIENVYIFYWAPIAYKKIFSQYSWELQIDTVPTFDSANLRTYNQWNARQYYDGNMVKAFEIEVFPRSETQSTFYWRVKPVFAYAEILTLTEDVEVVKI